MADGLGPLAVLHNLADGLHADALRGGLLDKRGASSRILDPHGELAPAEVDRLDEFAADFQRPHGGGTERGLSLPQGWGEGKGAYLSRAEVRVLFAERKLLARIAARLSRFVRPESR